MLALAAPTVPTAGAHLRRCDKRGFRLSHPRCHRVMQRSLRLEPRVRHRRIDRRREVRRFVFDHPRRMRGVLVRYGKGRPRILLSPTSMGRCYSMTIYRPVIGHAGIKFGEFSMRKRVCKVKGKNLLGKPGRFHRDRSST